VADQVYEPRKIPTGIAGLRHFRSFFLIFKESKGEPMALPFFKTGRAVPFEREQPFFYIAGSDIDTSTGRKE
jgi:hypothetical protein